MSHDTDTCGYIQSPISFKLLLVSTWRCVLVSCTDYNVHVSVSAL